MAKAPDYEHHAPRTIDKKKRPKAFNEEAVLANRGSRVNFKNYIRQLKEEELAEEIDDFEDDFEE
jgi:hypothetical protein